MDADIRDASSRRRISANPGVVAGDRRTAAESATDAERQAPFRSSPRMRGARPVSRGLRVWQASRTWIPASAGTSGVGGGFQEMREIIVAAVLTLALLGFGGLATQVGPWYRALTKPSWNPPDWLFGPAWTVILGLAAWAGVAAWRASPDPAAHARIAGLFGANMVLHALWSPLFFTWKRPDWALWEAGLLWLSVLALVVGLAPLSRLAPWLLAPYLAWVSFAFVLNAVIVRMNAPFGRAQRAG